jgi:hypothetical protein
MPLFVGVAAVAAGVMIARLRAASGGAPAPTWLVTTVAGGMATVGLVLLAIGWWAAGRPPAGVSPAVVASAAYVGASVELFFAAMLAPSALRASASANPRFRARRR